MKVNRLKILFGVMLISSFAFFGIVHLNNARAATGMGFLSGLDTRVSIDLRESDVVDVLTFLSEKGDFNIYLSPEVSGRVTLKLDNVRIADILDIVLLSNGLAYRQRGPVVYIMMQEEYIARYGKAYDDAREVELLQLQYADPEQVFAMLEPAKSELGSVVMDAKTGSVVLIDVRERLDLMVNIIEGMDRGNVNRIFDLDYANASEVQSLLETIGADSAASIVADDRSNQVAVTAFPNRMAEIESLVKRFDRRTREVAVDMTIVKVQLDDDYDKGVDWKLIFPDDLLDNLSLDVSLQSQINDGATLAFDSLSADNFEVVFQYLNTIGESKVLANPRVTVIEGEEAKILIGTREAYVTSTTTTGSSTSTTADNVNFIDVGISMTVTPRINKEGYVTMHVKPEVSDAPDANKLQIKNADGTVRSEIPVVDTTEAETTVMVKDGTTVMIGGLRKTDNQVSVKKIPFFADLPWLGELFVSEDLDSQEFELIVFITPHIIKGDENFIDVPPAEMSKGVKEYEPALAEAERWSMYKADKPDTLKDPRDFVKSIKEY